MLRAGAIAAATGSLAACGMFGGGGSDRSASAAATAAASAPAPQPQPPVKATGETVTIDDERSGSPVELRLDQQLVVRLHYDISSAAQWELTDFVAGALASPGPSRFDTHNGEAAVVLGGEQVWRFKPAAPGVAGLNFSYRNPRSRDAAIRTATFTITVR